MSSADTVHERLSAAAASSVTRGCVVPECMSAPRSRTAVLCPRHYHRQYRHGSVEAVASGSGISVSAGRRYRLLYRPSHPLAGAGGRVYEHRAVLFDRLGPGSHPCNWCGALVEWAGRGSARLQVDHLNGLGNDNAENNLVVSCGSCNTARAQQARAEALRQAGFWSGHDTIARTRLGRRRPVRADG